MMFEVLCYLAWVNLYSVDFYSFKYLLHMNHVRGAKWWQQTTGIKSMMEMNFQFS